MLATVDPAERLGAPTDEETRPVRLLVPTTRRSNYFMSVEDTLHASDLGVTRHTTDAELAGLIDAAADALALAASRQVTASSDEVAAALKAADPIAALASLGISIENPFGYLLRIRDALCHPRDIEEARAWGFEVPREDNKEEFDPRPTKRLGWWWVLDPTRVETRAEREARYLSDTRAIDMKGFARVICRAYITVKDWKFQSDNIRLVLDDAEHLHDLATTIAAHDPSVTVEQAKAKLLKQAHEDVLTAMPPRRDKAGQSDLWLVGDAAKTGRQTRRLNQWYEYERLNSTGRPPGAKTRRRAKAAA